MNSTDVLIARVVKVLRAVPAQLNEGNYTHAKLHDYVYHSTLIPPSLSAGVGLGVFLVILCCCTMCRGKCRRPDDSITYEGLPLITIKTEGRCRDHLPSSRGHRSTT